MSAIEKTSRVAEVLVILMLVTGLSLASWFGWEYAFDTLEGRCVGPVCIQADAPTQPTQGESIE